MIHFDQRNACAKVLRQKYALLSSYILYNNPTDLFSFHLSLVAKKKEKKKGIKFVAETDSKSIQLLLDFTHSPPLQKGRKKNPRSGMVFPYWQAMLHSTLVDHTTNPNLFLYFHFYFWVLWTRTHTRLSHGFLSSHWGWFHGSSELRLGSIMDLVIVSSLMDFGQSIGTNLLKRWRIIRSDVIIIGLGLSMWILIFVYKPLISYELSI